VNLPVKTRLNKTLGNSIKSDINSKSNKSVMSKIERIDEKNSFKLPSSSFNKLKQMKKFTEPITERSDNFDGVMSQFMLYCA